MIPTILYTSQVCFKVDVKEERVPKMVVVEHSSEPPDVYRVKTIVTSANDYVEDYTDSSKVVPFDRQGRRRNIRDLILNPPKERPFILRLP